MLVSALNSHPEIDCTHSDGGHHGTGALKGHAQSSIAKVKKAIVLTRNGTDRAKSWYTTLVDQEKSNHAYHPVTVERKHPHKMEGTIRKQEAKTPVWLHGVLEAVPDRLVIAYEDLTGNGDIRELPQKYSHLICDFLGVERRILKTALHKPKVIENAVHKAAV